MKQGIVIWRLTDGKSGHERQTEGLAGALAARVPADIVTVAVASSRARVLAEFCTGRFGGGEILPPPSLIIGAGRACQWPLLVARRARGGRAIYLMKPFLPTAWFDLCIVPRHDRPEEGVHVIASDGPLNPMERNVDPRSDCGLILLGGPSSHHAWDTAAVLRDVQAIIERKPEISWLISDSRRSPADLRRALEALPAHKARFVRSEDTAATWLPEMLARSRWVWVTADSVAMIYEALTAGAKVGIIDVPARRGDRITGIATALKTAGRVAGLQDWLEQGDLTTGDWPLHEAARCAGIILARWPELTGGAGPV